MKWLLALLLLLTAVPAGAKMVKVTDVPPPGYTCEDVYRSRDYGSLFGTLYIDDSEPTVNPYCTPLQPWHPTLPRPRQSR